MSLVDGDEVKIFYEVPTDEPLVKDVVGTGKKFLEDIILSIQEKKLFEVAGISPDKTYLLEGEAGTGKTYSVKALNNELNINFIDKLKQFYEEVKAFKKLSEEQQAITKLRPPTPDLAVFYYDIGRYGTSYVNRGSRVVQTFFDTVYSYANNTDCLVVLDEADALLTSRKKLSHASREDYKVLETFMKNLQEAHDTPNVYLVMMTNLRDSLDEAVLRAGRIDKKYSFSLPTFDERKELFKKTIDKINTRAGYKIIRSFNINNLAEMSEGYNGADVVTVVEKALRNKVLSVAKTRTNKIIPAFYVTGNGLEKAVINHNKYFKEKKKPKIGFL